MLAGWILELDRGEGIPWKGNYSSWLEQKTKRMEMEEKTASKRRKTLERELEWVRMAPKARQAKGKARLNSYDKLLNEDVKEKEEKLEIFILTVLVWATKSLKPSTWLRHTETNYCLTI